MALSIVSRKGVYTVMNERKEPIGKLVKMLSDAIGQRFNKDFKELNLTMQQTRVISFLKERQSEGQTTQKDIQDYLKVAHPTAVSILKGLEQKGLIVTHSSKSDRRMKVVCLTGQEEELMEKIIDGRRKVEAALLEGFSDEEAKLLRSYLKRLYENIKEE